MPLGSRAGDGQSSQPAAIGPRGLPGPPGCLLAAMRSGARGGIVADHAGGPSSPAGAPRVGSRPCAWPARPGPARCGGPTPAAPSVRRSRRAARPCARGGLGPRLAQRPHQRPASWKRRSSPSVASTPSRDSRSSAQHSSTSYRPSRAPAQVHGQVPGPPGPQAVRCRCWVRTNVACADGFTSDAWRKRPDLGERQRKPPSGHVLDMTARTGGSDSGHMPGRACAARSAASPDSWLNSGIAQHTARRYYTMTEMS